MWLTRFCLQRPIVVTLFFFGLLLFGLQSFFLLGRSLNPNITFPVVVVAANYPGASPADMERLIIKPIEDQIDGIDNLDKMSATAQEGIATVVVQFKLDTNLDYAAIDVQRRVDTARVYMPTDLDPPTVDKSAGSEQAPILTLALSSTKMAPTALSDLVHDYIIPDIKHIPNVQSIDSRGEINREFHVAPSPDRLIGTTATLPDVFSALQSNNALLPGGRMDSPIDETSVSIHAEINHASDLADIPLPVLGGAQKYLRIGDVATVSDNHVEERIISKFRRAPAIILDINRIITADEIKSTKVAREQIAVLAKKYHDVTFTEVDAPAEYTQASLNGVLQSLVEGVVLTAIVLMLFLHAWRNAVVVMIAIPASLLATCVAMRIFGFTLDNVSLMGLSLTIGILVDDSIVVLENITRHRDMGENAVDATLTGRAEIGGAAVAITLVDVVVFLPIAFLSGIVGKFMKEFGIVVVVATLFSLFVSFTLTPMLAARWSVKRRSLAPPRALAWFQVAFERLLRAYHGRALPFALRHRGSTAFLCGLLVINALGLMSQTDGRKPFFILDAVFAVLAFIAVMIVRRRTLGGRALLRKAGVVALIPIVIAGLLSITPAVQTEFIPSQQTGDISITFTYAIGTPIAKTQAAVDKFENEILTVPGVVNTITTIGTKPAGFGSTIGGYVARVYAGMDRKRRNETDRAVADIRKIAGTFPGAVITVASEGGGTGGDAIYYTLSGDDSKINEGADKMAAYIRSIPGTVNVQTGAESEDDRLNITIDAGKAAILGIAPGTAATAARIAIGGAVATKVRTQGGLVDVRVQFPYEDRNRMQEIQDLQVRAMDGSLYRLSDVASFHTTKAPTKIERLDKQRVVRVTGGLEPGGTSLGVVTDDISKWIASGHLPPGVSPRASGDSQFFQETISSMGIAAITSFGLVYMLMVVLYGSFWTPFVVMFSVPLALVGAMLALSLSGQTLNLFSMIGTIMLFGLVAKNGILMVDYANTLRHRGLKVHEAIMTGAETRFRPILMTTMAMVFGMLPLALGFAEGAEIRRSMGTVLIGGLLSSLILTLFLVPVIYTWVQTRLDRAAERRAARQLDHLPDFGHTPIGV